MTLTMEQIQAENTLLKAQIQKQTDHIEKLEKLNEWYLQQLKLSRAKRFGASSEKSEYAFGDQLNLFNEAEAQRAPLLAEPTEETITYKRKKKIGHREAQLAALPVETIEYTLPKEEQDCPDCGEKLHVMSKELRKELKIIPAKVIVVEHITPVYTCRNCEKTSLETPPIIMAPTPKGLVKKSLLSATILAHIMNQKFVNAMPLYRQEQEFKRLGILLSRQTLANWMIKGSQLLEPLIAAMKKELLKRQVLHADETTLEVLCEPDRPAQTTSYMWLYRSAGSEKPIILYDYQQGRSGSFAKTYLEGYTGYLNTDGWGGYHQLEPEVTLCGCWAHVRRKFEEALKIINGKKDSLEAEGLAYCNKLFEIERRAKSQTPEQRYQLREKESEPLTEEFFSWVSIQRVHTPPQNLLGKALQYAQNQRNYLLNFLKDGRIELSNNSAERSIKPFVIGRKNWLFCNTPAGASSSAIIYSIVETAKENGLIPYAYLCFIFERIQLGQTDMTELFPWILAIPQYCKLPLRNR